MILDRTHRIWAILSAAILIVATAIFVLAEQTAPHGITGGSLVGLTFGIAGSALMMFAGFLALRKRVPAWRIGSAQFWLRGHIWLGLLSVPLILFHSGFGWGGLLENLLWITFAAVIISGIYGLVVQHLLPRWMTIRVPDETFGEQVPHRCRWLLVESDKLVAELSGRLEVPVDELRDVAFDLAYGLGKLRNGKEEEDLARFLSAIYATSHGDASQPSVAAAANETRSPLAPAGGAGPGVRGEQPSVSTAPQPSIPASATPSKIEQMRAAAAKKAAAAAAPSREGEAPAELSPPVPPHPPAPAAQAPSGTQSKIEQMRAAAAAKKAASAAVTAPARESDAPAEPSPPVPPVAPPPAAQAPSGTQSKIEQMRAAAAAKKAQAAGTAPAPTAASVARRTAPETSPSDNQNPRPGVAGTEQRDAPVQSQNPGLRPAQTPASRSLTTSSTQPIPRADEVRAFYLGEVRPFLDERSRCRGPLGQEPRSHGMFAQLKASLPDELHPALIHLESCCDERRQFELQRRLHRWLHGWLLIHIPATLVLLVLFVAHVVMALRVVPWSWR